MLYLIGLGLNEKSISKQGLEAVKKCKQVYLENYTIEFPYEIKLLENFLGKKIIQADREFVESLQIVDEASKKDVALLIYGSPLFATTHISLIQEAKACRTKYEIIYNASIFDAISQTGLQLYKFGKISSMPVWQKEKNFTPDSFIEIVKENLSINAHSLILVDIGLDFEKAVEQFELSAEKQKLKLGNILVCSRLGTENPKIVYAPLEILRKVRIKNPFCFIVSAKLHFLEKEMLEGF